MKHKKKLYLSLSEEDCQALQALADESCRSRAGYLRRLIRAYLCYVEQHPDRKLR